MSQFSLSIAKKEKLICLQLKNNSSSLFFIKFNNFFLKYMYIHVQVKLKNTPKKVAYVHLLLSHFFFIFICLTSSYYVQLTVFILVYIFVLFKVRYKFIYFLVCRNNVTKIWLYQGCQWLGENIEVCCSCYWCMEYYEP